MPEKETLERARRDKARGKSPSTQAGEFVREEIHHVREGKHGARSTEQAIAIGLSKARRAGVKLSPKYKSTKHRTYKSPGHSVASKKALSRHAKAAARQRPAAKRAAWRPVAIPSPPASTPTSDTLASFRNSWKIPIALLPPPTHATSRSGSRPHARSVCSRASRPITDWKSRTIVGYGCGPRTDPRR